MSFRKESGDEGSPGRWAIVLEVRDPSTGQRKRKWHSFVGAKRAAQTECARLITEFDRGAYIQPGKTKVAAYLAQWLEHTKPNVAPRTHERHAEIVRKYINPVLGDVLLSKLQAHAIATAYVRIRSSRARGEGDLSAKTVLHCHRVLSSALRQAVRWRLLPFNPAADVKLEG